MVLTRALLGSVAFLAVVGLCFLPGPWHAPLANLYEDISYSLHPSAERAYAIGVRHFNGQNPRTYNIHRAAAYFDRAVRLDPSLLYIHHEIARIHFLHGDFADAMAEINTQIAEHGDATPNSYYVRALIEGYMGEYASSAEDYEHFLKFYPHDWAGINDYAWVLLKAGRARDAEVATTEGLKYFPNNPWLLNSRAIALNELGRPKEAAVQIEQAWVAVQEVGRQEWLHSYPGNDPSVARQGLAAFRLAVAANMHTIDLALATSTVQLKATQ